MIVAQRFSLTKVIQFKYIREMLWLKLPAVTWMGFLSLYIPLQEASGINLIYIY